ncbi:MAG: hypothetical protein HY816_15450 [Candidatus Wallbacteria bacterium]|nr:hypothetical protein [Candidatus Wallbacteria bacterium]
MRTQALSIAAGLALLAAAACAAGDIPATQALLLPGVRASLAQGTVAGEPDEHPGKPVVTKSVLSTSESARTTSPLVLALVVLEPQGTARVARLVVFARKGARMEVALDVFGGAPDFHTLALGAFGPGGRVALGIQWAQGPGPHEGNAQAWLFGAERPVESFRAASEGFYFEPLAGTDRAQLVNYAPDPGSAVALPEVYDWSGTRLVAAKSGRERLEKRLLADYDEVLESYRSAGQTGDPPRLVVDVALQKGRLLERRGELERAFAAYELAIDLVPDNLVMDARQADERAELLERVAEARKRAAAIYGLK